MSNVNKAITELNKTWRSVLSNEIEADYFKKIILKLNREYDNFSVFPENEFIFNAFNQAPFEKLKVVIIGQDPYFNKGQANGLCFSVNKDTPPPPSLKNIFKAISNDIKKSQFKNGDLSCWSKQGVLLLNSCLTVREGIPNSHKDIGWEKFTDQIIKLLSINKEKICFLLWGSYAQKKAKLIDPIKHLILKSTHPSPLSAYRGFLDCKHFSKTNLFLKQNNLTPIDWNIY